MMALDIHAVVIGAGMAIGRSASAGIKCERCLFSG